jgi:hypothetical protein
MTTDIKPYVVATRLFVHLGREADEDGQRLGQALGAEKVRRQAHVAFQHNVGRPPPVASRLQS